MARFLLILHGHKFHPMGVDKLALKNAIDKGFSVKSMYKGFDVSPTLDFPHRLVWNPVPQKLVYLPGKLPEEECSLWTN